MNNFSSRSGWGSQLSALKACEATDQSCTSDSAGVNMLLMDPDRRSNNLAIWIHSVPYRTQQRHYFRYRTVHTLCLHLPPLHFMTTNSPRNPCEGKHIIPLHFFTLNMERTINNKICTYPVHRLDIGVPFKPLGCVSPLFNSLCNTLICVLNNDVTHLLWKELAIDQQKNKQIGTRYPTSVTDPKRLFSDPDPTLQGILDPLLH